MGRSLGLGASPLCRLGADTAINYPSICKKDATVHTLGPGLERTQRRRSGCKGVMGVSWRPDPARGEGSGNEQQRPQPGSQAALRLGGCTVACIRQVALPLPGIAISH